MTTTKCITLNSKDDVYFKQGVIGSTLEQVQGKSRTNVIKNINTVYDLVEKCIDAVDDTLSRSYQNGAGAYVDYVDHSYSATYIRKYGIPSVTRVGVAVRNNKLVLRITREKLSSIDNNNVYVSLTDQQKQKAKEQIFKRFCKTSGYSIK